MSEPACSATWRRKRDDRALDVGAGEPQVGVGEDVAGRLQHARILSVPRSLYKQTMLDDLRDVTNDAAAPRVVTPPGGALPPHDIQFRVRYAETDQMGVVYHTNYLIWCEVGRTDFIRARGMSYADIERSGVGLAVSDLEGAVPRRGALRRPDSGTHDSGRRSVAKHHLRLRDHQRGNQRATREREHHPRLDRQERHASSPSHPPCVPCSIRRALPTLPTTIRSRRRRIANASTRHLCATRGGFRGRRSRRYGRVPPAATLAFDR